MAGRMGTAAREHALRYDTHTVYDQYWRPILADLAPTPAEEPAVDLVAA